MNDLTLKPIANENRDPFIQLKERWRNLLEKQKNQARQRLTAILDHAPIILQKYSIEKAILFGSVLNGKCDLNADIDLLLMPLSASDFWKIRYELEEAVGYQIDLYSQSDDPQFIEKIKQRGEVIYAAQH